ncbi:Gamma-D-glutamyl-L-lysine endopeptidase [Flavimaricola marinus]|uniref:Gamma-D-glutamyl-L-lysine endopeptidase n=2 Tax=Flavimaricola marinus TaxID=1819565 RepID=A0A238LFJ1_9RHOB|nr:Gamma-D-glutamyl-L-lysine endopeptidase [Flavimaricola marinus]
MSLAGKVEAERFTQGTPARIAVPVADLCATPGKGRDRQLIWGETITVFEERDGFAFVQADKDGYVGYLRASDIADPRPATHRVSTPATHLYETESFKSADLAHLSFGARVTVTAERQKMWETPDGYIPKKHLRPLDRSFTDPATVAQLFFGVPYLWGGNSILGIDCSGLVQAALTACDIPCPGDSDLQRTALGQELSPDAPRQRGDLYWWKGHIGMLVDADTLLHANAHHMAVAYEPIDAAILRIKAQGDGEVISRKRL